MTANRQAYMERGIFQRSSLLMRGKAEKPISIINH